MKEIESIIKEVTNKKNAQALERLRVKTIDAQAEALAGWIERQTKTTST